MCFHIGKRFLRLFTTVIFHRALCKIKIFLRKFIHILHAIFIAVQFHISNAKKIVIFDEKNKKIYIIQTDQFILLLEYPWPFGTVLTRDLPLNQLVIVKKCINNNTKTLGYYNTNFIIMSLNPMVKLAKLKKQNIIVWFKLMINNIHWPLIKNILPV